jgi:hypothetical protein
MVEQTGGRPKKQLPKEKEKEKGKGKANIA